MVIPSPIRPHKISTYLKPYVLLLRFTDEFVRAQVIHAPTSTVACDASTREKPFRVCMEESGASCSDVIAAAKIGKLLGERLLFNGICTVSGVDLNKHRDQLKVKAVIDSLKNTGVKLL